MQNHAAELEGRRALGPQRLERFLIFEQRVHLRSARGGGDRLPIETIRSEFSVRAKNMILRLRHIVQNARNTFCSMTPEVNGTWASNFRVDRSEGITYIGALAEFGNTLLGIGG